MSDDIETVMLRKSLASTLFEVNQGRAETFCDSGQVAITEALTRARDALRDLAAGG